MHKRYGFTIVELLIVIVVIGVLAAITVVAYTEVQNRAKFTRQASDMDKVARALQLYKANGGSMSDGVAGASGLWYGAGSTVYAGTSSSMHQVLIDSGYLPANAPTYNFMIALCSTNGTDNRRVLLGLFSPAPTKTPQEQILPQVCNHNIFAIYTDPAQQYKRNYAKIID